MFLNQMRPKHIIYKDNHERITALPEINETHSLKGISCITDYFISIGSGMMPVATPEKGVFYWHGMIDIDHLYIFIIQ